MHCHVLDTIVVLEEGNCPLLRCPRCDMFVPWEALNRRNLATAMCAKGAEQKRRQWAEEEAHAGAAATFQAYGRPLEAVASFKYLGRVLTASDYDWTAVVSNLRKARRKWARFSRILVREEADAWISGTFYKAAVQATLLFRSET